MEPDTWIVQYWRPFKKNIPILLNMPLTCSRHTVNSSFFMTLHISDTYFIVHVEASLINCNIYNLYHHFTHSAINLCFCYYTHTHTLIATDAMYITHWPIFHLFHILLYILFFYFLNWDTIFIIFCGFFLLRICMINILHPIFFEERLIWYTLRRI